MYAAAAFVPDGTGDPAVFLGVFDTMDLATQVLTSHFDDDQLILENNFVAGYVTIGTESINIPGTVHWACGQAFHIKLNDRQHVEL